MKAIMVVGTTSHAGKSFLTAALCRIVSRKGWQVAPFKAQNMALNAYVTPTGGEIGYAQAVQAWAACVTPRVEMNPILLKPQGNMTSQVIIKGEVAGFTTAHQYYEEYFHKGWQAITESISSLETDFDLLVCEGAGSPAEINLKHRDLSNMRVAKYLNAPSILIVDIDRGGAFAHVVGTLALLEEDERALIKGIVINKFRGDKSLLDPGITWLENFTGVPVIGVIPWSENLFPAEDSLDLLERRTSKTNYDLRIVVIRLPYISNFTDFDPLEAETSVLLEYLGLKENLGHPDAVIIPGSKTTISDMVRLKESGMAEQLKNYVAAGGTIIGICGGYQILGKELLDPNLLEGRIKNHTGLDLLPIKTTIMENKISRQRQVFSSYPQTGLPIDGYEIHQGFTQMIDNNTLDTNYTCHPMFSDPNLGLVNQSKSIWGCYLHGLFDNGPWRRLWLNYLRLKRGLPTLPTGIVNYRDRREDLLDNIANIVETHLDLTSILPN